MFGIRKKIVLAITICSFSLAAIIASITIIRSKNIINEEINEKLNYMVEAEANNLNINIGEIEAIANGVGVAVEKSIDMDKYLNDSSYAEEYRNYLKKDIDGFIKPNNDIVGATILLNPEAKGQEQILSYEFDYRARRFDCVNVEKNRIFDENGDYVIWTDKVINEDEEMWSSPYSSEIYHMDIISCMMPIYVDEKMFLIVSVNIDYRRYRERVNDKKIYNSGYYFLLDENLNYLVHDSLGIEDNLSTVNNSAYKNIAEDMKKIDRNVENCIFKGQDKVLSYKKLSNGWVLVASVVENEAMNRMNNLTNVSVLILVIGLVIFGVIALIIGDRISKPIVEVTKAAEELAKGNLNYSVKAYSNDETGTMVNAINKASSNISNLVDELTDKEEVLMSQVEELKQSKEEISNLAFSSRITGLPNKNYLINEMGHITNRVEGENRKIGICYLDVDNFKTINDTLGHSKGDEFLVTISKLFKSILSEDDILCHIGGDEFVFILTSVDSVYDVVLFTKKLLDNFKYPFKIEGSNYYITISAGLAMYPENGNNLNELLKNSDVAMYEAKNQGKNTYEIFKESMNVKLADKIKLENDLRKALSNNEFVLNYQPKYDSVTKEIVSMEALVRWLHPSKGMIYPNSFIPLAEEKGLIIPLGEFVLWEACRQNKMWQDMGLKPVRVAVNLSQRQLYETDIVSIVKNVLEATKLDPEYLEIEITETMIMNEFEISRKILKKFREMGIKISLDDFGTGYSSLNYLIKLPINSLKLDKTFVDKLTYSDEDKFITSTIIKLAHGLDLSVVGEGVETEEQYNILCEYKCDEIQGYLFSKPLSALDFEKKLKENKD
ncbi:MAG: EAL domain-containing protein [Clostridiaceae bacterium]